MVGGASLDLSFPLLFFAGRSFSQKDFPLKQKSEEIMPSKMEVASQHGATVPNKTINISEYCKD